MRAPTGACPMKMPVGVLRPVCLPVLGFGQLLLCCIALPEEVQEPQPPAQL